MDALRRALDLMPEEIFNQLRYFKNTEIEEIRIRLSKKPCVVIGGLEQQLSCPATRVSDMKRIIEKATGASYHMAEAGLAEGYINCGGLRIGVCGHMSRQKDNTYCFRSITSLAIRIPRECKGILDGLVNELYGDKFKNTLIISAPGGGKTTAIRELCRVLSGKDNRVALLDERNEILADDGRDCFDLGLHCDVLTGVSKAQGSVMLLRTMNPQIIAMDEITKPEDVEAVWQISSCGVSVLASAHGMDKSDLLKRKVYRELMDLGVFEYLIYISGSGSRRKYTWEKIL